MIVKRRCYQFMIALLICLGFCCQGAMIVAQAPAKASSVAFMSVEELKTRLAAKESLVIIDVRSSETFANSDKKITGAIHLKVRRIEHRLTLPPLKDVPRDRTVVTYCSCPA